MKHNYTNELELKSIIIRIQTARKLNKTNGSNKTITVDSKKNISENRKINKYIQWASNIQKKNFKDTLKVKRVQNHIKEIVIKKSEVTPIDYKNYERFGAIIMEMVKHILTKPQFRGYTYFDDFMSDSVFKILKYLDNFDHTIISKRSGEPVKAFAYISQIIQNSIIYIILLEQWEVKTPKLQEKEIHIKAKNVIKRIYDILEENKEYLKDKNNILVVKCKDYNDLDIDDLSGIESIKKVYKNFKFTSEE